MITFLSILLVISIIMVVSCMVKYGRILRDPVLKHYVDIPPVQRILKTGRFYLALSVVLTGLIIYLW